MTPPGAAGTCGEGFRVPAREAADELEALRTTVSRVRSMRDVATDGKVTVAAIDWALGDLP